MSGIIVVISIIVAIILIAVLMAMNFKASSTVKNQPEPVVST